jgi:hypothetical protein
MNTNTLPAPSRTSDVSYIDALPMGRNGHKRNGKIAKLPQATRERINTWLDDGYSYPHIIEKLGQVGAGLKPGHFTHWYQGGYQDHLNHKDRRDDLQTVREWAADLPELNDGPQFRDAVIQLGFTEIFRALTDPKTRTDPLNRIRLLNTLARLNHEALLEKDFRLAEGISLTERNKTAEDSPSPSRGRGLG